MALDPVLIDADDRNRASRGKFGSPEFRRMVALVWPHRRFILIGVLASVVYGALHSVSIVGVLPVLKVMLSEEGFHGWVYRSVAEDRLDARLTLQAGQEVEQSDPSNWRIRVIKVGAQGGAAEADLSPGDVLWPEGTSDSGPVDFLRTLATVEGEVRVRAGPPADSGLRSRTLHLKPIGWKQRAFLWLSRLVPPEESPNDRIWTLACILAAVVIVVVLANLARFAAHYVTALGVLRGVMDLRRQLYTKVLRLPMSFFSQDTSDIVSRFVQDVQEVQRGLVSLFGKVLREPLRAVFLLLVALALNARLTLVMLLVGPIVVAVFWAVGRKIRKANSRLLRTYGSMIGALTTTLDAMAVVKAYNAEHVERQRLWRIDRHVLRDQLKIAWLQGLLPSGLEILGILALSAVTLWLGARVIQQEVELAEFATLVAVLAMLTDPLRKVADVYPRVMRSAAGAQRIFSVVDAPPEEELDEGAVELRAPRESITLENVTFSYPEARSPSLYQVSLSVPVGQTVALVGPNGSGKTTLTRLLVRFYDPQEGRVLVDGVDIRRATLRSLRRQFSMVTQDPVVFAMTIAENIGYGARNAERDVIEDAARRAHADDFVSEKGAGYDEPVGERGATLSGGQRQRLCIARAVLRDAPVLIFDEATSQIDSESEQKIQQSLAELSRGRTTFLIAHRLSTIRYASRIVVMDAGTIVDVGQHEELFERCRLYRTLCETQLAG